MQQTPNKRPIIVMPKQSKHVKLIFLMHLHIGNYLKPFFQSSTRK